MIDWNDPKTQEDLHRLSSRVFANRYGCAPSTARDRKNGWSKRREKARKQKESPVNEVKEFKQTADGTCEYKLPTDKPMGKKDIERFLKEQGHDVAHTTYNYGFTVQGDRVWNRLDRVVENKPRFTQEDADRIIDYALSYAMPEARPDSWFTGLDVYGEEFVLVAGDLQIGETDEYGGTNGTLHRFRKAFCDSFRWATSHECSGFTVIDPGDVIENECQYSYQKQSNDLELAMQVQTAATLLIKTFREALEESAPSFKLRYVTVPSNHGRNGGKNGPGEPWRDDWGVAIAMILKTALSGYRNFEVILPEPYEESLCFSVTDGVKIGVVHGHQAGSLDGLSRWWAGQVHGLQPLADADILVAGHYHTPHMQLSGANKILLVAPSLGPGSKWYAVKRGTWSAPGYLAFTVGNNGVYLHSKLRPGEETGL